MRGEGDALESLQLADRPGSAAVLLMNVNLRYLIGSRWAGVLDIGRDFRCLTDSELRLAHVQVRESERGVTEAIAERIQRRALFVPIALALTFGALGGVMRIVNWHLARIARPGHREFSSRNGVAEEQIGDGIRSRRRSASSA